MPSLREQRERMSTNAGYHEQHDVDTSYAQRNFENSLRATSAMNVDMHIFKCTSRRVLLQAVANTERLNG